MCKIRYVNDFSTQLYRERSMRIINVMVSKTLGGVEQAFLDYNAALSLGGHQVLAVAHKKTKLTEQLNKQNIEVKFINFNHLNYFLVFSLYKNFKKFAPDIIITHSKKAIPILRIVANLLKVPLVGVSHNPKYKLVNRCDAIFSITQYQKDIFINKGFPAEKIFVIPNCIGSEVPYNKKTWHNPPVIGTMGRFDPVKGFDVYLKALAVLKRQKVLFKAVLGGDKQDAYPKEPGKLLKIIEENRLESIVNLAGWITDINKFYNDIDIFVLPSKHESFGIVLLEAMSSSTPLITSDAEGPSEIFAQHQDCAYMFTKENPQDLAQKLKYALEHQQQTQEQAQKAWELCHNKYSTQAISTALTTAVESTCKEYKK